jgi:hypothetical protein
MQRAGCPARQREKDTRAGVRVAHKCSAKKHFVIVQVVEIMAAG